MGRGGVLFLWLFCVGVGGREGRVGVEVVGRLL